jgi:TRAP-type mannitol/chloroaromatic compound transport system permease large subunit
MSFAPELMRRGYPEPMVIGTLAGSGTLGLLIPPSIIMIVYGVAAEVSISKLFIAGIFPGILLSVLFSGYLYFGHGVILTRFPRPIAILAFWISLKASSSLVPVLLFDCGSFGFNLCWYRYSNRSGSFRRCWSACAVALTRLTIMGEL